MPWDDRQGIRRLASIPARQFMSSNRHLVTKDVSLSAQGRKLAFYATVSGRYRCAVAFHALDWTEDGGEER
jgi:hypothetical protein